MKGVRKLQIFIFSLALLFNAQTAKAIPVFDSANFGGRMGEYIEQIFQFIEDTYTTFNTAMTDYNTNDQNIKDWLDRKWVPYYKALFIDYLNSEIQDIYMTGNDGMPYFVTDWQDYLYKQSQDFATDYVSDTFLLEKFSGGECKNPGSASSPYYLYLCDRGDDAIKKLSVQTNLPEYFDSGEDPKENLFMNGDIRAFSAYFECGNNPYCSDQEVKSLYSQVTSQKKTQYEKEASGEGALPKKNDEAVVSVPGKQFEYSINDAISIGNQAVVNAQTWEDVLVSVGFTMMEEALKNQYTTLTRDHVADDLYLNYFGF